MRSCACRRAGTEEYSVNGDRQPGASASVDRGTCGKAIPGRRSETHAPRQNRGAVAAEPGLDSDRTEEQKTEDAERAAAYVGLLKGQVWEAPGCWDEPEPDFQHC